ncbi:High-affnity carbon uptake protein Hat/HatR [Minicystis rosea]|nr:High-affnity carbon uptake protein Hat/HatR [Minicystis rosea]
MTTEPEKTRLDPEHPCLGPSSFDEEHAAFFHGRGREAEELFALVELRPLTVLYSKSGLGKTSLLQAGLFPRMRKAGLVPLRFRLSFGVDEAGERQPQLVEQVRRRLREATQRGEIDGAPPREGETLWEYFHWTGFWDDEGGHPATPVLVLDQFEEVLTLRRDRADELRELSDLVENRIPARLRDAAIQGSASLPPSFEAAEAKVLIALRSPAALGGGVAHCLTSGASYTTPSRPSRRSRRDDSCRSRCDASHRRPFGGA